jgi:SAM-dependent methyltransferase
MAEVAEPAFDYRTSHTRPGRGDRYERLYRPGTALAFYWQTFERPYLDGLFARLAAEKPDGRYLDFACGTGRILDLGADHFVDVTGVDVSEPMVEVARAKRPTANIIIADVLANPVDVGDFDVITLFRFLVRAGDLRERILSWLRGVVRDDGVLIVNNHRNANSVRGMVFRARRRVLPQRIDHEILSDREVRAMLGRCGFRVVEEFGFDIVPSIRGHLLIPARLLLPIERRLARSKTLCTFAKNRIYVCVPIVEASS